MMIDLRSREFDHKQRNSLVGGLSYQNIADRPWVHIQGSLLCFPKDSKAVEYHSVCLFFFVFDFHSHCVTWVLNSFFRRRQCRQASVDKDCGHDITDKDGPLHPPHMRHRLLQECAQTPCANQNYRIGVSCELCPKCALPAHTSRYISLIITCEPLHQDTQILFSNPHPSFLSSIGVFQASIIPCPVSSSVSISSVLSYPLNRLLSVPLTGLPLGDLGAA